MKRTLSTLITSLLFSGAMMPNAIAQMHKSGSPISVSIIAAVPPEQTMSNSTRPSPTVEVVPEPSKGQMPSITTVKPEESHSSVDRSNVDNSYPAYCSPLPPGTKPGDWEYRAAIEKCLYGS